MPAAAFAVHGLSADFLAKHPVFARGALELLEFLEDSPLVAHNARFDFGFLNHELKLCGHREVSMDRMIDTVAIARQLHPGAKHSLDALCTRYGIDRSHRVKHGALLDAELLAQLYIELTGGRQIGLGLAQEEIKESVRVELTAGATVRPVRPARVFTASAAELERHAAFVATLKEPLWLQEA
jgi:DNA polymerase-3 subunit epsilon